MRCEEIEYIYEIQFPYYNGLVVAQPNGIAIDRFLSNGVTSAQSPLPQNPGNRNIKRLRENRRDASQRKIQLEVHLISNSDI